MSAPSNPTNPPEDDQPEPPFELESGNFVQGRLRYILIGIGWIFVGLGFIGLVVPLMPGFVFFLGAAWAFSKSSPRFEHWLMTHPRIGPAVRDWRTHQVISTKSKAIATGTMTITWLIVWQVTNLPWQALTGIGIILILVSIFLITRPSRLPDQG